MFYPALCWKISELEFQRRHFKASVNFEGGGSLIIWVAAISVEEPHRFDVDPFSTYHSDADPDAESKLHFSLMRIRIFI
jgi:hypothetical protein